MKEVHDHSFNVNVAEYFRSVEKAILLKEFYGWIKINKDNNRNIHYGEAWTYNSAEALNEKFRYMKPKSIWRWLDEMSNDGFICINRFNEKRYDKTNWYAINWAAYVAICEGKSELIKESISQFKKFQKLVFDSQNEKSISQNKKRYSQNKESISQDKEPIPSLTISSSSHSISEHFVEKEFSTVTLIDEVDETSVEIHHVPEYFDTEQKKERKRVAPKKKESDDPTPIRAMFELYADKYAELNNGVKPEFMVKYTLAMKNLYGILRSRSITSGFVPLDNLEPWRDFLQVWGDYLAKNEKEKWHRDNFNPLIFFSQFNSIIAKLNNRPKTDTEKWIEWGKRQGL